MKFGQRVKRFWQRRKEAGFPIAKAIPKLVRLIVETIKAAKG